MSKGLIALSFAAALSMLSVSTVPPVLDSASSVFALGAPVTEEEVVVAAASVQHPVRSLALGFRSSP
jgi:hypothetical protein